MKNFTIIPNEVLSESQLSISARYLYCVLLRYCGQDEYCWPSQKTLGKDLGCTSRHIRTLINELENENILTKKRKGWNRSNTYRLTKFLTTHRNSSSPKSKKRKKSSSPHLGSKFPLHQGSGVPPINTYLKGKDNNKMSKKGFEQYRKDLCKLGIIKDLPQKVKPTNKGK